ncbi:hypothetical protein [Kitasatospora sp. NPDC088779]|uniref:hypothetical protein n=1 Tax=Kitasatospora sp. NPDC088779 TaxID=3154964 RepID=UPI0034288088
MRARRWDFVSTHAAEFGVQWLCEVLGVARSGYYAWRAGAPARAERASAEAVLVHEIRGVHQEARGAYGVSRVHTLTATLAGLTDERQRFSDEYLRLRTDLTPQMWKVGTADAVSRLCLPDVDVKPCAD